MSNTVRAPKCPYLSSLGLKDIQCTLHARLRDNREFESAGDLRKYVDNVCYKDFDQCETYKAVYAEEMASTDKHILEYRECSFCCNNSGYTGLKSHDGSTHGFCQIKQEDVPKFDTTAVCEWFNRLYRKEEDKEVAKKAKVEQKGCPCWKESSGPAMPQMYIKCQDNRIDFQSEDEFNKQFDICNHHPGKCERQLLYKAIAQLDQEFKDWNHLNEFGGQDPSWSDGCNMNLVHNHITYHKKEIEKICSENNIELPDIYHKETPPEVDRGYMARADEIRINAKKSLELYTSDEDYQYLLSTVSSLDKKQKDQTCIANVIGYATGLEQYIKADELVDMRRHENPERYLKSFSECAEKVRALMPVEEQKADDCCCEGCAHSEDWGESVEYINCAERGKRKDVRKKQLACTKYVPVTKVEASTKHHCGDCNYGHWYSGDYTYTNVVQDDGIHTIKRPCEPQTHYCYQFSDGQRKIAADKDFNPDSSPDWCPLEKSEVDTLCETEECLTNAGSGSCVSGTAETGAISTVDKPTATTAEDLSGTEVANCENFQIDKDQLYIYRGLV